MAPRLAVLSLFITAAPTAHAETATLVLAVLNVSTSYQSNAEQPATSAPDTVQWWLTDQGAWRIRTYGIDHDIHIHRVRDKPGVDLVQLAIENIENHYSDISRSLHVIKFPTPHDLESVHRLLTADGLATNLEQGPGGLAFWTPDGERYRTQSEPR